jgi:predicted esterase
MSQGALTSLAILLRYNGTTPLGGVVIESGTMVLNRDNMLTTPEALYVQGNTPIFIYHGTADKIIN